MYLTIQQLESRDKELKKKKLNILSYCPVILFDLFPIIILLLHYFKMKNTLNLDELLNLISKCPSHNLTNKILWNCFLARS